MSTNTVKARLCIAKKTESAWKSLDPVLLDGELAISIDVDNAYKLGNGTSKWSDLNYAYQASFNALNDEFLSLNNGGHVQSSVEIDDLTTGNLIVNGSGRFTNGLYGDLTGNASSADKVDWSGVQNKPSSYTPSSHTHDDRYYTESEINTKVNTLQSGIDNKLSLTGGVMQGNITGNLIGNVTGNATTSSSCSGNSASATKAIQDSDGNTINSTYFKKSGGTLTGALTFANGTWNTVGDDVRIGDINIAGTLGIIGANGNTAIKLVQYNTTPNTGTSTKGVSWVCTGDGLSSISGTLSGSFSGDLDGNATTATCLKVNDIRGIDNLPNADVFRDHQIIGFFNQTGTPNSDWWSGFDVSGWTKANYQSWQLISGSSISLNNSLYYRNGIGNTWQQWKKIAFTDSNITGNAASASKLTNTTAIGSATQPIYFTANGVPVATTYALNATVPANAKFTDTTYTLSSFGITSSATELNYCVGITSNIQSQLNGKAASSHGTHVTYGTSTTALTSGGTGTIGSATTLSRSDHTHTLPAYPTTLPASDVYTWAKASTKPTYTASEVGAPSLTGTGASGSWGINITGNATSATTATNVSGGTVSATTGTFSGQMASITIKLNNKWTVSTNATSGSIEWSY